MKQSLIIDIGTGGIHACLADVYGNLSANQYREIVYALDPETGGYEFDAEDFFDSVMACVGATLAKAPAGTEVACAGITSQRHGCVFLDKDDRPLIAFPNVDGRAATAAASLIPQAERIYAITGRWPAPWFPGARLLWYRRNRPEIHARIVRLMMLNEYVIFRLTGAAVSEWSNAAEILLFDIHTLAWSDATRSLCSAESLRLNTVMKTGAVAENLRPEIAGRLGLPAIPVVLCASDTQSATMGCGNVLPGEVAVVNGSTTPLLMPIGKLLTDPEHRVQTDPYYDGEWALEANTNQSGMIHRRLVDQLLALVRRLPGQHDATRETLYALFADQECDPKGMVMNWGPLVCDMGKHWFLPKMAITGNNSEENLFLSIIPAFAENLAFAITANARLLTEISGLPPGRIILTGGGSANIRLQKALSALNHGRELFITNELETTSRGAAIQSWMAVGQYGGAAEAFAAMKTEQWCTALAQQEVPGIEARYERWQTEQQQLLRS